MIRMGGGAAAKPRRSRNRDAAKPPEKTGLCAIQSFRLIDKTPVVTRAATPALGILVRCGRRCQDVRAAGRAAGHMVRWV